MSFGTDIGTNKREHMSRDTPGPRHSPVAWFMSAGNYTSRALCCWPVRFLLTARPSYRPGRSSVARSHVVNRKVRVLETMKVSRLILVRSDCNSRTCQLGKCSPWPRSLCRARVSFYETYVDASTTEPSDLLDIPARHPQCHVHVHRRVCTPQRALFPGFRVWGIRVRVEGLVFAQGRARKSLRLRFAVVGSRCLGLGSAFRIGDLGLRLEAFGWKRK